MSVIVTKDKVGYSEQNKSSVQKTTSDKTKTTSKKEEKSVKEK